MTIDTQAFNNDVGADREVEPSFHLVRVVVERAARELTRLCELGAVSQLLVLDRACSFSFNQRPKSSPPAHTCILDFGPTSVEVSGYLLVRGGTGVRSDGALCNRMMNQWGILTRLRNGDSSSVQPLGSVPECSAWPVLGFQASKLPSCK